MLFFYSSNEIQNLKKKSKLSISSFINGSFGFFFERLVTCHPLLQREYKILLLH